MSVSIRDTDTTTADFAEGTLTDVVAVNDGLELANNPALEFDGVDDYVNLPQLLSSPTEITIEGWFNCDGTNVEYRPIAHDNIEPYVSFRFNQGGITNRLQVNIKTDVAEHILSTESYDLTNFNHICMTAKENGGAYLYVNGVEVDSVSGIGNFVDNGSGNNYIGMDRAGTNHFHGIIDEVRIWGTARIQQEIQDNMNKELNGDEAGLVAYYKTNESTGTTLIDSAGNNDGTINGATWTDNYISWNLNGAGTRQSPQLDLSPIGNVESSSISWQETLNSQTITVETSVDGGSTWQTATNGGSIPNLTDSTSTLDVRQTLETTDTTVTPVLEEIEVYIDTAVVNEDTGVLQETETYTFYPFKFNDTGTLGSTEDNSPLMVKPQQDSGYFNADAENLSTILIEAVDEGSLTSIIDNYNHEGWITNPKNTSQWTKIDENKDNLWTKVEKNTADWKKVGGE